MNAQTASSLEFALIARHFTRPSQRVDVVQGIGDDCALLRVPSGMELAITIDTLVGGVHFLLDSDPYGIGWKTLAVSLSDLAAMGAEPAWATLALTLPDVNEPWLQAFSSGLFELADQYNVALVGGNTSRGPLSIALQAHGFTPPGQAIRRAGAEPGDLIYVTGTLGDAAVGLDVRLGRLDVPIPPEEAAYLCARLERPEPRVAAGLALRGIASSAIDLSDGLVADLGHILKASQVGAVINLDSIPRSTVLRGLSVPWEKIVGGGDDYELCFTVPPDRQALISPTINKTPIGVIQSEPGIRWCDAKGHAVRIEATGFRHF